MTLDDRLAACDYIAGSDEAGMGSWAGPLVVCAVVISRDWPFIKDVRDSKAFAGDHAEANRQLVADKIRSHLTYSLVTVSNETIDKLGVYKANIQAHERALTDVLAQHRALGCVGSYEVVVDGTIKVTYELAGDKLRAHSLPKADALVPAVSAASILAKVNRDKYMSLLAEKFPGYDFQRNKGYGGDATHAHSIALKKLGPCEVHRRSFAPIRDLLKEQDEPSLWDALGDVTE